MDHAANPYVGPRAFLTAEQKRFFGREQHSAELMHRLIAERIILLAAPSGAGKTSLIQAGLIPRMQQRDFEIVGPARVGLAPVLSAPGNRYINSLITALQAQRPAQSSHDADLPLNLVHYFEEYWPVRPRPQGDGNNAGFVPQLLIIDQFEEILTLDAHDRTAKTEFFLQLGEALRDGRRWALFAMREEFRVQLGAYAKLIPGGFAATWRLDLLDGVNALAAVTEPAKLFGVRFSADAAEKLVEKLGAQSQASNGEPESSAKLADLIIEPVQLQVICRKLWSQLPAGTQEITADSVQKNVDVDQALADYYNDHVTLAAPSEDDELALRTWISERLIISKRYRNQIPLADLPKGLSVEPLLNAYLLRRERRNGTDWLELSHDRLVAPIQANNMAWIDSHRGLLEQLAKLWDQRGKDPSALARGAALKSCEAWAKRHPTRVRELPDRAFLLASRAEVQRRKLWFGATAGVFILLFSLGTAGYFVFQNQIERQQTAAALALAQKSIEEATIARNSEDVAWRLTIEQEKDRLDAWNKVAALQRQLESSSSTGLPVKEQRYLVRVAQNGLILLNGGKRACAPPPQADCTAPLNEVAQLKQAVQACENERRHLPDLLVSPVDLALPPKSLDGQLVALMAERDSCRRQNSEYAAHIQNYQNNYVLTQTCDSQREEAKVQWRIAELNPLQTDLSSCRGELTTCREQTRPIATVCPPADLARPDSVVYCKDHLDLFCGEYVPFTNCATGQQNRDTRIATLTLEKGRIQNELNVLQYVNHEQFYIAKTVALYCKATFETALERATRAYALQPDVDILLKTLTSAFRGEQESCTQYAKENRQAFESLLQTLKLPKHP